MCNQTHRRSHGVAVFSSDQMCDETIHEELHARSMYQGQGQVITSRIICGM